MFKVQLLIISISLSLSDILTVYSQTIPGGTTENVVTIKNYFKPEELTAALNKDNQSEPAKGSAGQTARANFARTARAKTTTSMEELFKCVISLDTSCLLDHVENIVDNANNNLLQQADAEARRIAVGREDSETETPSSLIATIAKMVLELPELIKESLGGIFRAGKGELGEATEDNESDTEDDEEEEEANDDGEEESEDEGNKEAEEEEDESNDGEDKGKTEEKEQTEDKEQIVSKEGMDFDIDYRKKCGKKGCSHGIGGGGGSSSGDENYGGHHQYGTAGRQVGGSRGKKKKKKKALVKLLLLGLIIKAKITLLLKVLAAKLQIKFLLIALANLLLNLARFWWDLKKGGHEPQKVIYYEHAQHQHHYDGADDWQSSPGGGGGGGGGYWGRAYESEDTDDKSAQDIAYSKQIPKGTTYTRINDKPNISWNPWG